MTNRIALRVYEPPEECIPVTAVSEEPPQATIPATLPFRRPGNSTLISGRIMAPVERARILKDNDHCPECGGCSVSPLELSDALISPKSRLPIPGTATIVGFHCDDCGQEWPVYSLVRRNG